MKKLFAIAAATAMLGAGSAAFAADSSVRLDDAAMDSVSAGGLFIQVNQSNNAYVEPLQAVEVKSLSFASKGGETKTNIYVSQNTSVKQFIINKF